MWLVGSKHFVFGHAAIVVEKMGPIARMVQTGGQSGIDVQELNTINVQPNWVYQCSHAVLADMAAKTAYAWYLGAETDGVVYSKNTATASAFVLPRFRERARERAREYRMHSAANGPTTARACPPSFSRRGRRGSRVFCSMLTIAAYQASTHSDAQIEKYMGRDAIHTSPLDLNLYLKNNGNWPRAPWGDYNSSVS